MIGSHIITNGNNNSDGKYGNAIQNAYDMSGIPTNRGPGTDVAQGKIEIKTRSDSTNSSLTISTYRVEDIIATDGKIFLDKLNYWHFYTTSDSPTELDEKIVSKMEELNFKYLQSVLEDELRDLADQLRTQKFQTFQKNWGRVTGKFFEIENSKAGDFRYGKLRAIGSKWKKFKEMVKSSPQFNRHFE